MRPWIYTKDQGPPVGQRILIVHNDIAIGAVLIQTFSPDWLFYQTDYHKQLAPEMVERWMEMPAL